MQRGWRVSGSGSQYRGDARLGNTSTGVGARNRGRSDQICEFMHCDAIRAFELRAGDGVRTRDIQLGKLALYQLSYSREGDLEVPRCNNLAQKFVGA